MDSTPLGKFEPLYSLGVFKTGLPADIFDALEKHIDAECADADRKSYAAKLAGRIERGEQIEATASLPAMLKVYICALARRYVLELADSNKQRVNPALQVSFVDSWIVRSLAGDYNPIHAHGGNVSGIIYIEVPPEVADPDTPHGKLEFVFGQYNVANLDFFGSRRVVPRRADMYLFPAWMHHLVYPFAGNGQRTSYSFNLTVSLIHEPRSS